MKLSLLDIVLCPDCGGSFQPDGDARLVCAACGQTTPVVGGTPMFTPAPENINPSEKQERSPELGTPWRQENWRFLARQLEEIPPDALILDVGAGRGDFFDGLKGRNALALDVYPYPEIDMVCDLTRTNPFKSGSVDVILLLNVLEHVYDSKELFAALSQLLKPGGKLLVAIPFMVKMHQIPLDFVRYTHFALEQMATDHGLEVSVLEGFYDPMFFLGEGIRNIQWPILRKMRGWRQYVGRALLMGVRILARIMQPVIGPGHVRSPHEAISLAPTGYQIVYRKK
ncbi:MAG: methyltransferase domain-containing protein [Chloroflexi bacterium]|nr:methyltransferase domain-containing protein [Chloroflexota bacterium]